MFRYFQLMELHGCATVKELATKLKSSANVSAWIIYLEMKEEIEQKKMQAMIGTEN